jgi:hypothetical protein
MSDQDLQQLKAQLQGGRAALAVLVSPEEAAATTAELEKQGGTTRNYAVSDEDLQSAHEAIQQSPEAAAAVAEAATPQAKSAALEAGAAATEANGAAAEEAAAAPAATADSTPSA